MVQVVSGQAGIQTGAECTDHYVPFLVGKKVAVVANQSSLIGSTHLVDSLLSLGVDIKKIYSPEHGFRGVADAGKAVKNGVDPKTGLTVISLYGKNHKPSKESLSGIDLVIFDLQDVGARFFTYFSTMCYVMEACAESNVAVLILDRPNPNGYYIDGPILEPKYASFVGKHPIPIVHGLTAAEYARMANKEGWLAGGIQCELQWVLCRNYSHSSYYILPVKPSPNLTNSVAIRWYPTLALFEGIEMSIGRGTDFPFQVIGHPDFPDFGFSFKPEPRPGAASSPRFNGKLCHGIDLRNDTAFVYGNELQLDVLIFAYENYRNKAEFFNSFFLNLSGTSQLKDAIISGRSANEIREGWQDGLQRYQKMRAKYLLYEDSPIIVEKYGAKEE